MTHTSLIYVASAVLGVAAGIATLAGVQAGRTGGSDILLACDKSDPSCTPVQTGDDQILLACNPDDPGCTPIQQGGERVLLACDSGDAGCQPVTNPVEQIQVVCDSGTGQSCDYRSSENIVIASADDTANPGIESGNG